MKRRGLTLMEVLIALALLGALLSAIFVFYHRLSITRDRAAELTSQQQAATILIDRIEADLATCLVGDTSSGAGVTGDAHSLAILSRSVDARRAAEGGEATVFSDLQRSTYRFDAGAGHLLGDRATLAPGQATAAALWPIGSVGEVRFRFHDGTRWVDSFDSLREGRLPMAVEVAVWYAPWRDESPAPVDATAEEDIDRFASSEEADFAAPLDEPVTEELDIPRPDRIRVIAVPDAEPEPGEEPREIERGGAETEP